MFQNQNSPTSSFLLRPQHTHNSPSNICLLHLRPFSRSHQNPLLRATTTLPFASTTTFDFTTHLLPTNTVTPIHPLSPKTAAFLHSPSASTRQPSFHGQPSQPPFASTPSSQLQHLPTQLRLRRVAAHPFRRCFPSTSPSPPRHNHLAASPLLLSPPPTHHNLSHSSSSSRPTDPPTPPTVTTITLHRSLHYFLRSSNACLRHYPPNPLPQPPLQPSLSQHLASHLGRLTLSISHLHPPNSSICFLTAALLISPSQSAATQSPPPSIVHSPPLLSTHSLPCLIPHKPSNIPHTPFPV